MTIVIRMTSHSNDESLEWRVSLDYSHEEWSLAWWVITHMTNDHSYDDRHLNDESFEWWVTWMTSVTRMSHSNEEWHSHDEWWFAWCKIMYHPVYKMTIFAMVMQIHLKSMVNHPFIWKCKVKRMCSMNEWKINTMLVQLRI